MYNLLDWKFVHQHARHEQILKTLWKNFILQGKK